MTHLSDAQLRRWYCKFNEYLWGDQLPNDAVLVWQPVRGDCDQLRRTSEKPSSVIQSFSAARARSWQVPALALRAERGRNLPFEPIPRGRNW